MVMLAEHIIDVKDSIGETAVPAGVDIYIIRGTGVGYFIYASFDGVAPSACGNADGFSAIQFN
jgi:hypothetical protein